MVSHTTSLAFLFVCLLFVCCDSFSPISTGRSSTVLSGLFDGLQKAFANEEYSAPPEGIKATARHILVKSSEDVPTVLDQLQTAKFADVAREFSTCPSGKQGGSLGSFAPGMMVPEFDKVIFSPETALGEVVGPVQTKVRVLDGLGELFLTCVQFGYHLIVVDKRTGV